MKNNSLWFFVVVLFFACSNAAFAANYVGHTYVRHEHAKYVGLWNAVRNGHYENVVEELNRLTHFDKIIALTSRYDELIPQLPGAYLMHVAATLSDSKILELLVANSAPVDCLDSRRETPLLRACNSHQLENVEKLLALGANPNAKGPMGGTPLMIACEGNQIEMMRLLLKHGANASETDNFGANALHQACGFPVDKEVIEELLAQPNIDVNASSNLGIIPLLISIMKARSLSNVEALLAAPGIDVNVKCNNLWNALHYAVSPIRAAFINGETNKVSRKTFNLSPDVLKLVKALLAAGVDPNAKTKSGVSVLDMVYDLRNPALLELFRNAGVPMESEEEAQRNFNELLTEINVETDKEQRLKEIKRKKRLRRRQNQKASRLQAAGVAQDGAVADAPDHVLGEEEKASLPSLPQESAVEEKAPVSNASVAPAPRASVEKTLALSPPAPRDSSPSTNKPPAAKKPREHFLILVHDKFKWPKTLTEERKNIIKERLKELAVTGVSTTLDIEQFGEADHFRLRSGDHRIIFYVDNSERKIYIRKMGLRRSIYK